MKQSYGKKVKELMVDEFGKLMEDNKGFVFTTFEKVNASKMDGFRKQVKRNGSKHMILKKRLARLALDKAGLNGLTGTLEERENVSITIIKDNPVSIAKMLLDFSKANKTFKISGGCFEGQVFDGGRVKELAEMPSREQLLAMVVGTLNAPISGFVNVLASVVRGLPNVLNAIKEKKESE